MKDFIEVLKNNPNGAYDFICNNYYKMSKDELKDIVKELLYAVHDNVTKVEHDQILNDVATELEDNYEED
jgi:formate-dependent nitrite reductase cytochrome c552 subunit